MASARVASFSRIDPEASAHIASFSGVARFSGIARLSGIAPTGIARAGSSGIARVGIARAGSSGIARAGIARAARVAAAVPAVALVICVCSSPALGSTRARQIRSHGCAYAGLMPTARNLGLVRAATLCLINRERVARGERPLLANARLQRAAQEHTESMAFGDYFEHVGPSGMTPLARLRAVGYISSSHVSYEVGENIAWGTLWLATPGSIVGSWMRSPGHRANILDPRYRETGIGVSAHPPASLAQGQPGAIYTQDFGVIIHGLRSQ